VLIRSISNPWRDSLLPASFRGAFFHVDTNAKDSGRRTVVHEFPKRDYPYSEDMGRRAYNFTVRGYCIAYPNPEGAEDEAPNPQGSGLLARRDYRLARNALEQELIRGEPGLLQLPSFQPMTVVCQRFRLTEEEKFGGFCVFDMQFTELGIKLGTAGSDPRDIIISSAEGARQQIVDRVNGRTAIGRLTLPDF
jgi:prophage DNA circulation protein